MMASALSVDRERCPEASMDDYVPNPVQASDLGQVVKRWGRKTNVQ